MGCVLRSTNDVALRIAATLGWALHSKRGHERTAQRLPSRILAQQTLRYVAQHRSEAERTSMLDGSLHLFGLDAVQLQAQLPLVDGRKLEPGACLKTEEVDNLLPALRTIIRSCPSQQWFACCSGHTITDACKKL